MKKLIFLGCLIMSISFRSYGDTTYYHIQPIDTTLFNQNYPAEFSWYVPNNVDSIQGIYFFINGVWGSSLNIIADSIYTPLANRHNVIIMGCKMHPLMSREANIWSADATVNAIDSLSIKMGKPYVGNLPIFMEGYSLGGQFAYHFTRIHPDRVIAYTTMKGGVHDTTISSQAARSVPSLWFMGGMDTQSRRDNMTFIYNQERGAGALTALLIDSGGFHDRIYDTALIFQFFRSSIELRVNRDSINLLSITDSSGYIMNDSSFHISGFNCAPFNTDSNSWFVDSLVAIEAQRFVSNTRIDSHKVCLNLPTSIEIAKISRINQAVVAYPNPSKGLFDINLNEENFVGYELYDLNGKQLSNRPITNQSTIGIDLQNEADGIYILRLLSEKDHRTLKLIKY